MSKFIILLNGGVFYENGVKNSFERKELDEVIGKWSNGEKLVDEDGDVYSIEELIDCGGVDLYVDSMVEMGDDFVSIEVVELS